MLVVFAVGLWCSDAHAYPVHRRFFEVVYAKTTRCELCHTDDGGSERNTYGKHWQAKGDDLEAFRSIESFDSDGDGSTNRQEIDKGSNPGDASSTPDDPGTRWSKPQRIPIPVDQIRLVVGTVERIDAWEPTLTAASVLAVERGSGLKLSLHDRYPTLYFGVEADKRTAVALFSRFQLPGSNDWLTLLLSADSAGKLQKVALFGPSAEQAAGFLAYLRCLEGHDKTSLPKPGTGGCVGGGELSTFRDAVAKALWIVETVMRSAPTPSSHPSTLPSASNTASPNDSGPLPFDAAPATAAAPVYAPTTVLLAVLMTLLAMFGSMYGAVKWALRFESRSGLKRAPRLSNLSSAPRLLAAITLMTFLLQMAVGATDAYVQTRVVHASGLEYFQYLSWPRLLGITHSHLFGFGVLYGIVGLMVTMTGSQPRTKCGIISICAFGGIFDVIGWWGLKSIGAQFEWVSITAGTLSGVATLCAVYLIARELMAETS